MEFNELSPQMRGAKTRLLKLLEKRLKIAALQMEGRSKQVAFSRFNNQTGRLRQSIAGRFAVVDGKPTAILQAGGQFGGAELEYARFIEFGTRYIKPRRFLGRSIEAQQKEFQPKLQDLLRAALIRD
tara:strand:- start:1554 stop:1934 length:381 start_codon:yes stop_codon:yes gene_type:complete